MKREPYNPDEVWNIEGPARRKQEEEKRKYDLEIQKKTLDTQAQFYRSAKISERVQNLTEGKKICDDDLAKKDLER